VYVYDEAGNEYLEALAGLWCTALGFGEERLAEAASQQLRTLPYYHQFGGKANDVAITLSERIVKLMPVPMSKVFFNNPARRPTRARSSSSGTTTTPRPAAEEEDHLAPAGLPRHDDGRRQPHRAGRLAPGLRLPIPQVRHTDCPYFYRTARAETEEQFAARWPRTSTRRSSARIPTRWPRSSPSR
jgi:4-aminobutyrate--pyruvate transaminase